MRLSGGVMLFVLLVLSAMTSACGDAGACAFAGGGSTIYSERGICYDNWEKQECADVTKSDGIPYAYKSGESCEDIGFTKQCAGEYFHVRQSDWCL